MRRCTHRSTSTDGGGGHTRVGGSDPILEPTSIHSIRWLHRWWKKTSHHPTHHPRRKRNDACHCNVVERRAHATKRLPFQSRRVAPIPCESETHSDGGMVPASSYDNETPRSKQTRVIPNQQTIRNETSVRTRRFLPGKPLETSGKPKRARTRRFQSSHGETIRRVRSSPNLHQPRVQTMRREPSTSFHAFCRWHVREADPVLDQAPETHHSTDDPTCTPSCYETPNGAHSNQGKGCDQTTTWEGRVSHSQETRGRKQRMQAQELRPSARNNGMASPIPLQKCQGHFHTRDGRNRPLLYYSNEGVSPGMRSSTSRTQPMRYASKNMRGAICIDINS